MLEANTHSQTLLVLSEMFWDPLCTNLAVLQMFMKNSVNSSLAHWQAVCNLPGGYSTILPHKGVHCSSWFLSDDHMCLTWSWHVRCNHTSMTKITTPSENCCTWHTLSPIHILHSTVNVSSTNTFCRQKLDYCVLSLFGGIHGTIVNCYLASVSVNNTLPLSSVCQISPDIHCHLPEKSQSSTAGNNGAPTCPTFTWARPIISLCSGCRRKPVREACVYVVW